MLTRLVGVPYLVIEFLAKFPYAMATVAVMTSVSAVRGNMGEAGATAALVGVGTAISGPLFGAAADRFGQRPVLLVSAVANALALTALGVALSAEAPTWLLFLCGLLIGGSAPQASSMVRARWLHILGARVPDADTRRRATRTILSYQSMTDELVFVFGPVVTGLVAVLLGVVVPLYAAALLTGAAVLALALHPTAAYTRGRAAERSASRRRPGPLRKLSAPEASTGSQPVVPGEALGESGWEENERPEDRAVPAPVRALFHPRVLLPVLGMVAIGFFFGSLLASLTGLMETLGREEATGVYYGALGIGSAVCALAVVLLPERFGLSARWIVFAGIMAAGAALSAVQATNIPVLVVALVFMGCGVGPALVTLYSIASDVAPFGRTTTVMASMSTGIVVGQAGASAITGAVIEATGYGSGFALTTGATLALVLIGLVRWWLAGSAAERRAADGRRANKVR